MVQETGCLGEGRATQVHKAPLSCTNAGMNKQDKRKNDKMCTGEHMYPHIVPGNKVMFPSMRDNEDVVERRQACWGTCWVTFYQNVGTFSVSHSKYNFWTKPPFSADPAPSKTPLPNKSTGGDR